MSVMITPRVYATQLGNIPAKSVLASIAEQVNDEGFGWPSVAKTAEKTEVHERTVRRVIQVLATIGLLTRTSHVTRAGREVPALQINLDRLGRDMRAEFAAAYAEAQGRKGDRTHKSGRTDTSAPVLQTEETVAQTAEAVSQTEPLKPHIGGTVIEPSRNLSPLPPQAGACGESVPCSATDDELNDEQRAYLDRIASDETKCTWWRGRFIAMNREAAVVAARANEAQLIHLAELERLQAAIPTIEQGVAYVLRHAGIVDRGRRRGVAAVVRAVLEQEHESGIEPWDTAPKLAQAWQRYRASGHMLRVNYGPVKFYELGIWRDERGWAWDEAKLAHNAGASVGRLQ